MNTKEEEKMINEIKNGENLEENIKIIESMVGGFNVWESIEEFLEKHGEVRECFREICRKEVPDGCCGYSTNVKIFIEYLVAHYNDSKEEAYSEIYYDIYNEDDLALEQTIEVLNRIQKKMKYK